MTGLQILIIDSSKHFSLSAKRFLLTRSEVASVETVTDPAAALEAADIIKPNLVLADDSLVGQTADGCDLLVAIRQKLPGVIIALMTLYQSDDDFSTCSVCEQVNRYISKQDFAAEILPLLSGRLTG